MMKHLYFVCSASLARPIFDVSRALPDRRVQSRIAKVIGGNGE